MTEVRDEIKLERWVGVAGCVMAGVPFLKWLTEDPVVVLLGSIAVFGMMLQTWQIVGLVRSVRGRDTAADTAQVNTQGDRSDLPRPSTQPLVPESRVCPGCPRWPVSCGERDRPR